MVGPVLDEIRFPFNLEGETSASITGRTNLSVNSVGTKLVTISYYHQNNIDINFIVIVSPKPMTALSYALTDVVSVMIFLSIIRIIISYEVINLMINQEKFEKGDQES
jgi:hypothetical protein